MFYGSDNFSVGVGLTIASPSHRYMADQTFHTPNFGDEEFDIPPLSLPQHHGHDQHHGQMSYSMGMGHVGDQQGQQQHHYASMYMPPEHMTHSPYGGSPPTYTTLSSPHAPSQSPHGNPHAAAMMHHQQQQQQQMGRPHNMGGPPPGRSPTNSNSPGNQEVGTSEDSNDSVPVSQINSTMKRPSPEPINDSRSSHPGPAASTAKKSKPQKKKKKRDPNEPQKPVSAYALFFRDTQAAIKGQNPNASFGEVSKIVASMWDALDVDHKNVYKKKTEAAKKEYLKALAAYRASLVSKGAPTESADGSGMYPPNFNATMNSAQQAAPVTHYSQNYYASQPKKAQQNLINGPTGVHQRSPPAHQMPPQNHSMMQQMSNHGMEYGVLRHSSPYMNQMPDPGHAMGMGNGMHMSQQQVGGHGQHVMTHDSHQAHVQSNGQVCVRNGCGNSAITSQEWDEEYCSSDCVVTHCRDVFTNWVSTNQSANSNYHPAGVNKFNGPGNAGLGSDGIPYVT